MYVSQTLDQINAELTSEFPNENNHPFRQLYERYSSFKVYSISDDIEQLIVYGKVISVVYMSLHNEKPTFHICQHSSTPKKCITFKVDFLDDFGFNKCGVWYAPIEISLSTNEKQITQEDINNPCSLYGILCPCISRWTHLRHSYAVICNNWKYRDKHNVISLPEVSMNLFLSTLY